MIVKPLNMSTERIRALIGLDNYRVYALTFCI
jgi:hypothetical protein